MRRLTTLTSAAALVLSGGLAAATTPGAHFVDREAQSAPPHIEVSGGGRSVVSYQGSYCWSTPSGDGTSVTQCADQVAPQPGDIPGIGRARSVVLSLSYPVTVRTLDVAMVPVPARRCSRTLPGRVTRLGPGRFRLRPVGPAGRYLVSVQGRADRGEIPGLFRWRTTAAGPYPRATAEVGTVVRDSDHPHQLKGIGFVLVLDQLAARVRRVSATVLVRAANGRTARYDAGSATADCTGRVFFPYRSSSDRFADLVARLGPTPLTYRVALRAADRTYVGRARYPRDLVDPRDDYEVGLRFTPPLPSVSASRG